MTTTADNSEPRSQQSPRLLPIGDVVKQTGICRTAVNGLVRAKTFPAPVKIGRRSRWLASDVDRFVSDAAKAGALPMTPALTRARLPV
jgi:predicted DNA-binding transcriptional regulator AlpA